MTEERQEGKKDTMVPGVGSDRTGEGEPPRADRNGTSRETVSPGSTSGKDAASSEAVAESVDKERTVPPSGGRADAGGGQRGGARAERAAPAKKEAPAKESKEPKEPDPREAPAKALLEEVLAKIKAAFPDAVESAELKKFCPVFLVKREFWRDVVEYLKTGEGLGFRYLECMAGVDYPAGGYIEVVTYLTRMPEATMIEVKTRAPREAPEVPSIVSVFPGANWEEREIYDLLGVEFKGHPDLRRIMLPDDWKGHPLRKDYSPFE
ncbi:MAG: NADH-quinone oxidoreductase subunit C [Alicyclobacillaceae bacterium]|nr:NADH-quinone oxidoreductase subunit C [Alicyclobacillaceae bacterium]